MIMSKIVTVEFSKTLRVQVILLVIDPHHADPIPLLNPPFQLSIAVTFKPTMYFYFIFKYILRGTKLRRLGIFSSSTFRSPKLLLKADFLKSTI